MNKILKQAACITLVSGILVSGIFECVFPVMHIYGAEITGAVPENEDTQEGAGFTGIPGDNELQNVTDTHSPRYTDKELQKLLDEAQSVWPKAELSRDRMHIDIPFVD